VKLIKILNPSFSLGLLFVCNCLSAQTIHGSTLRWLRAASSLAHSSGFLLLSVSKPAQTLSCEAPSCPGRGLSDTGKEGHLRTV